jgi:SAM-dependent methyltransferase
MAADGNGEVLYGHLATVYDRIYGSKSYREESAEVHAIDRATRRGQGRSLLDVGCGTGRHLDEFRRWYPDVAGVDLSPAMLGVARARLGPRVPLTVGDMRSFDLGRRFDTIVCLFSGFGYLLSRGDRDRALRTFRRHLTPGGVVLVEGWILPDRWRDGSSHLQIYDGSDLKVARLTSSSRRGSRSVLDMQYLVAEPGKAVRHYKEVHRNALIPAEETLGSFRRAGLRATVRRAGRWRGRGLFVGVAPPEPSAARSRRP